MGSSTNDLLCHCQALLQTILHPIAGSMCCLPLSVSSKQSSKQSGLSCCNYVNSMLKEADVHHQRLYLGFLIPFGCPVVLCRQKVRALVRSADVTSKEYGAYVVPVSGDVSKAPEVAQALVGAETVIVTGRIGPHLLAAAQKAGVTHIMLPSLAGTFILRYHH
jgi:hypothetical protein